MKNVVRKKDIDNYEDEKEQKMVEKSEKWKNDKKYRNKEMVGFRQEKEWKEKTRKQMKDREKPKSSKTSKDIKV